jgi:hypothetical protein
MLVLPQTSSIREFELRSLDLFYQPGRLSLHAHQGQPQILDRFPKIQSTSAMATVSCPNRLKQKYIFLKENENKPEDRSRARG